VFAPETLNVKGKIERKFSKSKNLTNFDILGVLGAGVQKFPIVSAKGTSLRESTSFEPFCVKIGWGLTSTSVREKSQKVTEAPIGKTCRR